MKDEFVFRYDRHTQKGIIRTNKGEFEINLKKKTTPDSEAVGSGGSGGGGYGLHLI
ncbi:MAG: hypothetical protein IJ300_06415 [Clostridia bacterium]|nr:hypothetical protein [Clostridia bacterium]